MTVLLDSLQKDWLLFDQKLMMDAIKHFFYANCYYQTHCVIIRHLMLLSNKSCYYQTTHVIIKHLMLLSTPQPIILTLHIILLFYSAALAHRGATGRALA